MNMQWKQVGEDRPAGIAAASGDLHEGLLGGSTAGPQDEQRTSLLLQKRDEARQRIDALLKGSGDSAAAATSAEQAIFRLAEAQLELQEVSEFMNFARSLCRNDPRFWRAAVRALQYKLGRPKDALALLTEVHRQFPENAEVCCYLAKLQPKRAEAWYEKALRADPRCTAALLAVADVHRKAERFGEAARLFEAAHAQEGGKLPLRALYRFGEALVQDHQGQRGRAYLLQVLTDPQARVYHVHAAVTIALSFLLDQEHEQALQYCQRARELCAAPGSARASGGSLAVRLSHLLQGITELRLGCVDAAVRTLSCAANGGEEANAAEGNGPQRWQWDQTVQHMLGYAATLHGDFASAQRHMDVARQLAGPAPHVDVLEGMAYLRQAEGDLEGAEGLLRKCLEVDSSAAMPLLRMGYVLLCQEQLERSIQFLQKCLRQPRRMLRFGAAQEGAAHLYLCVAQHGRATGHGRQRWPSASFAGAPSAMQDAPSPSSSSSAQAFAVAEDHFCKGYELQPSLRQAMADANAQLQGDVRARSSSSQSTEALLEPLAAQLVGANRPLRCGTLDLTQKQAAVLLLYGVRCGVLDAASSAPPAWAAADAHCLGADLGKQSSGNRLSALAIGSSISAAPPLVGTTSTAAPTTLLGTHSTARSSSVGPSCDESEGAAHDGALNTVDLHTRLPPNKIIGFDSLELGDYMSHGEFTTVYRGTFMGRDVVVKTLHQKACLNDEQAAEELRAEIAVIAELRHPRLVTFVGACLQPARVALVTELAPGGNLHQALHVQRRQFSRAERFQLALELLEGVAYMHGLNPPIAHLDLKSMNLVLDAQGEHLQICDFGLARRLLRMEHRQGEAEQRPPSRGGSPRYMSPECHDDTLRPIDEKADVWSCACILIEIFGSVQPWAECSNQQQILRAMLVQHEAPSIPESIEAPVQAVMSAAFAFEAAQRPQVSEVARRLQVASATSTENKSQSRLMWVP
eukprot:TRINITY_DN20289_c0_g3_i3.p1 TRINITY_DN20289_c0_g3~~TRINITY_DN20289_c0_g3_i3.p1  ORF type:complete len:973 (+),score=212.79 TRINITY_DN20289_c0_g3_i3:74-2992(+)